jgi:hypothetical protein
MAKLQEAIRLYEEAMRTLARSRKLSERTKAMSALQRASDLLASAVAKSESWTENDEADFAAFTARWEE